MVILGGLEIVAAGYLIHKHQQHKKDRALAEEEEAYLEEEEDRKHRSRHGHGHGSHSRRRHSRERRHSYDEGKHEYRRESPRPRPARSAMRPPAPQQVPPPVMAQQSMRPPVPPMSAQSMEAPPPYNAVPTATPQPAQDIKYGWTDEPTPQQQQPPQQDPNYPPTGWPQHWPQSQTPDPSARLGPPSSYQRDESSRSRENRRAASASPHVRFAVPRRGRSPSASPPPTYRA